MTPDPKLRGALEPAWSELREQRLLGRIAEARLQRAGRRRRRTLLAMGALLAAGAATAVTIGVRRADQLAARRATANAPRLTLADGSEATLASNGNVRIEEQTATRVRLRQHAGSARYVVQHNPSREFAVTAGDVTVRVRGTIFSIAMDDGAVEVSVERGRVEVTDSRRTRDLVAGESLTIPARPPANAAADSEAEPVAPAAPPAPRPSLVRAPPALALASNRREPGSVDSGAELLVRADAARAAGRPAEAARALEAFLAAHPRDSRAPAALFTLGRVESARGRWQAAAAAFDRCAAARADGPLTDDALAEAAQAWHAAGVVDRARADARASLAAHPNGLHVQAMRRLAGP